MTNDQTPQFTFQVLPGGTATSVSCQILQGAIVVADIAPCASGFSTPLPLNEGVYELLVTASDEAGHSHTDNHVFEIDLTPPSVIIVSGPSGSTGDTTPTFEFVTEPGALSTCQFDTGPQVACVGQFSALSPLSGGGHTFTVRATDAAGNVTSAVRAFSIDLHSYAHRHGDPSTAVALLRRAVCLQSARPDRAHPAQPLQQRTRQPEAHLTRGDATTPGELGDPTVDTEYAVCVWDYVGGVPNLVMEMVAPAAGNCVGRPGAGAHSATVGSSTKTPASCRMGCRNTPCDPDRSEERASN